MDLRISNIVKKHYLADIDAGPPAHGFSAHLSFCKHSIYNDLTVIFRHKRGLQVFMVRSRFLYQLLWEYNPLNFFIA